MSSNSVCDHNLDKTNRILLIPRMATDRIEHHSVLLLVLIILQPSEIEVSANKFTSLPWFSGS